jgi:hypothetical protein
MSIPFINKEAQIQIANFVQQSFTLKATIERLLHAAKCAIETALKYINEQTKEVLV